MSKVRFHKETEPYVSVAVAHGPASSVVEAEVNLKYIWDLVAQAPLKPDGVAFVVDSDGQLISHPDLALVLANTNLAGLSHVRNALSNMRSDSHSSARRGTSKGGVSCLPPSPSQPLAGQFREQSVDEAFRPVYASIARSVRAGRAGNCRRHRDERHPRATNGATDPRDRIARPVAW